jgi:hypothetical protein
VRSSAQIELFANGDALARKRDPGSRAVGPIAIIDPANSSGWNARCLAHPDASVFHSAEWARVLLETYRWKPFYLETGDSQLPLVEAASCLSGRRGISLPFSDFSPALGADKARAQALFTEAVRIGRSRNWKYLELRGGIENYDGVVPSEQFYAHELDLTPGPDRLFAALDPSVRRAIRKAEQHGVTVTLSTDNETLLAFWRLHNKTRRKHGVPPQPFRFMRNIHEFLLQKGLGFIALAKHQGQPVAASMFLVFGKRAVFKFGASDPASQNLRGANAAFWAATKHCAEQGFSNLHFGRTDMCNAGLRRFKLGWGAGESLLSYCRYDLRKNSFVTLGAQNSSGIATRVFRRLPEPVLRLLGNILYRHVA